MRLSIQSPSEYLADVTLKLSKITRVHRHMIELHRAPGFDRVLELYPTDFLRDPVEIRLAISIDSLKPATTNIRRLGSVKNCPCKNMVIVGPYLTYHDHLV